MFDPRHRRPGQTPPSVRPADVIERELLDIIGSCDSPWAVVPIPVSGGGDPAWAIAGSPEVVRAFRLQAELFEAVFGREPRAGDPFLWDREREQDGPVGASLREVAPRIAEKLANTTATKPCVLYAIEKTGIVPAFVAPEILSYSVVRAWMDAIEEHAALD